MPQQRKNREVVKHNYKNEKFEKKPQLSNYWATPAQNPVLQYNYYQDQYNQYGTLSLHMTTFEEFVLNMFVATVATEAQAEIKSDEFQDFFERHFDKDNQVQKKEIFDIVSKKDEVKFFDPISMLDQSYQAHVMMTFMQSVIHKHQITDGPKNISGNQYMRVRFGNDIRDIFWNPYG